MGAQEAEESGAPLVVVQVVGCDQDRVVPAIDGRAAGQQGVGAGWAAVVRERAQEGVLAGPCCQRQIAGNSAARHVLDQA